MPSKHEDIAALLPARGDYAMRATLSGELPTGSKSRALADALASASRAGPSSARRRFDPDVVKILSLVGDGVVCIDHDGCIILVNRAAEELFGYRCDELVGCPVDILIPERFREAHRADVAGFGAPSARANRAMATGREVFGRHRDGREFAIEATLSRDIFGGEAAFTAVIRDVTARKTAEEQRLFLANEVAHRLRNTMAVVASIATLTARQATTVDSYREALLGRLTAISRTNDLLISGTSVDAGLSSIISAELAPFQHRAGNVVIAGPDVRILGKLALDIALLMHELATNAIKYGALSVPMGSLTIDWQLSSGARPVLDLVWQEANGPPVAPPTRSGFGSRLIAQCLRTHLGVVDLTYPVGGARCEIRMPLSSRAAANDAAHV